jgi:hypothetical protein
MNKKEVETTATKQFHELFPFALEWFIKIGNKKLEHNAYFPYDDYRERYAKRLREYGAIGIKKSKTKPRNSV